MMTNFYIPLSNPPLQGEGREGFFSKGREGFILLFFLFLAINQIFAQDTIQKDGYRQFFYQNGKVSSEGFLRDGKPDGYWKAYNENGSLKSEGNRKDFELDSLWKFYDSEGKLILEINYLKGKKEGIKKTWIENEIVSEMFSNDIKEGFTTVYFPSGKIRQLIPFVKGQEQGFGKEFDEQGTIVTLTEYRKGFVVDRIRINRRDGNGRRQGRWFTFYPEGQVKTEAGYLDDLLHGYYKEYAINGDLLKIVKYEQGIVLKQATEVQKMELQQEYYPNGKVKISAMFRNGVQEGLMQEYDSLGNVIRSEEYSGGRLAGEGIVKEDGERHGAWKEFYHDGSLKATGNYDHGKQTGEWKYFYPNGKTEQIGRFGKSGKTEGTWRWFFDNGQLFREENYRSGLKDGLSTTYNEEGEVIEEGDFLEGNEDGPWFERIGDTYTRGAYRDGMRDGLWESFYLNRNEDKVDSVCFFRGSFNDDNANGKHTWFYENGKVKSTGQYIMGRREGNWLFYQEDGTLFLVITYRNGAEVKYDGVKIKPPFEREDN
jgi:antitoxin component YwqK of YwqJK toxin-antitoxin module